MNAITYQNPKDLISACSWGVLATLTDTPAGGLLNGFPYNAAVQYALSNTGDFLFFISSIARHTQYLNANPKAAIMVSAASQDTPVLASSRATCFLQVQQDPSEDLFLEYLARHPEAQGFRQFHDLSLYRGTVLEVHWIRGFAQVQTMTGDDFRKF
jgi:putative heme iron utilization protein